MKKIVLLSLLLFCAHGIFATLPPEINGAALPSLHPMLKKVTPAVVNLYVQGIVPPAHPTPFGPEKPKPPKQFQDVGSGVIVDAKKGYILTNAHVVHDGQVFVVTLSDGRRYKGKLIGSDVPSDIAVLQINAENLAAISFADSDKVEVGDFVVAIGNPFGLLNQSVTSGVVSALNRSDLGIEGYENFIQTDAPINPGNSGGALVNIKGELVGINTAIIAPAGGNIGIGFAIPSNMAKGVMDQLVKYGKVERGLLGIFLQDLTPDLADALNAHGTKGALVTQVGPNSPAGKAGLQAKDIIVEVNGKAVTSGAQLRNTVGLSRVGSQISLKVLRNGKTFTLSAAIAPKEQAFGPVRPSFLEGARLRDYDELDFNSQEVKGVQIMDLNPNSPAALKGLIPSDVILTANNQPIHSVSELVKIANSNPKRLLLQILRPINNSTIFVVIDNN